MNGATLSVGKEVSLEIRHVAVWVLTFRKMPTTAVPSGCFRASPKVLYFGFQWTRCSWKQRGCELTPSPREPVACPQDTPRRQPEAAESAEKLVGF